MRVLHVISSLDPKAGGPTAALLGLASAQVRAGLEVGVLATVRGEGADAVVPMLTAELKRPSQVPLYLCAESLGLYGKDAAAALCDLRHPSSSL